MVLSDVPLDEALRQLNRETGMNWNQINGVLKKRYSGGNSDFNPLQPHILSYLQNRESLKPGVIWAVSRKAAYALDRIPLVISNEEGSPILLDGAYQYHPGTYACDVIRLYLSEKNISFSGLTALSGLDYKELKVSFGRNRRAKPKSLECVCTKLGLHWEYFVPKKTELKIQ